MRGEQQEQTLALTEMWVRLADDRTRLIKRHPELAKHGELEEEGFVGD